MKYKQLLPLLVAGAIGFCLASCQEKDRDQLPPNSSFNHHFNSGDPAAGAPATQPSQP